MAVVGIVAVVGLATITWLEPAVVGPAVDSIRSRDDIKPGNVVFGITWLRESLDWWPSWGGYAIAAALAVIPARGRLGLGLGMLAGMAAVPNLWRHYLPTVAVGLLLVAFGIRKGPQNAGKGLGVNHWRWVQARTAGDQTLLARTRRKVLHRSARPVPSNH
jgi:hypothetical protein